MSEFLKLPGLADEEKRFRALLDASGDNGHILLVGERGTGKSYFEDVFKQHTEKETETINCAALHPDAVVSELFGHKKGSFSGAIKDRDGIIKTAAKNKKVLFLDEINSLSEHHQAYLLHFLETGKIRPLGADKSESVNIRIIAAMNTEKGTSLRQDVIDRFRILVNVPPLRARRGDVLHYVAMKYPDLTMTRIELLALYAHHWPGNVRELERTLFEMEAGVETLQDVLNETKIFQYLIACSLETTMRPSERVVVLGEEHFRKVIPWRVGEIYNIQSNLDADSRLWNEVRLIVENGEVLIQFQNVTGRTVPGKLFEAYFKLLGETDHEQNLLNWKFGVNEHADPFDMAVGRISKNCLFNIDQEYLADLKKLKYSKAKKILTGNQDKKESNLIKDQVIQYIADLGPYNNVLVFLYDGLVETMGGVHKELASYWDIKPGTLRDRIKKARESCSPENTSSD